MSLRGSRRRDARRIAKSMTRQQRAAALREGVVQAIAAVIAADPDYIGGVEDAEQLARRCVDAFSRPAK